MVLGVSVVLMQSVGVDEGVPKVLFGVIVIVPPLSKLEQTGALDVLTTTE
jgi:hypothetical protein